MLSENEKVIGHLINEIENLCRRGRKLISDRTEYSGKFIDSVEQEHIDLYLKGINHAKTLLDRMADTAVSTEAYANDGMPFVTMPDVIGQTSDDAVNAIKAVGFENVKIVTKPNPDVIVGTVHRQSPDVGANVARSEMTYVYVA